MKQYFVQTKYEDGGIVTSLRTERQILEMFGFRDCTNEEYAVFDVSEFGKVKKLEYKPAMHAPYNFHTFIDPETGKVEFDGFSAPH